MRSLNGSIVDFTEAFHLCDGDKNGKVTGNELEKVLKSLGMNPTKEEVADMIKFADLDGMRRHVTRCMQSIVIVFIVFTLIDPPRQRDLRVERVS